MTTNTPLAPIVKTQMGRRIIHGGRAVTARAECWGAKTTDGVWEFERADEPGTPWLVYRRPPVDGDGTYRGLVAVLGSLRSCRVYVASGAAQREYDRLLAHERGEHKTERDLRCGRC